MTARVPGRRDLFGGAGAAVLAGTAALTTVAALPAAAVATAEAAHPDAELLALCGQFDALEHRIKALYNDGATPIFDDDEREEALAPLWDRQEPLLDRICAIRARTQDGVRARVNTLVLWDAELSPDGLARDAIDPGGYWNERMLAALLRDMTATPIAAVRP